MIAQPEYPGKLIAVEGIDGAGKSTQLHLLERWLAGRGSRVFYSAWESSDIVRDATKRGKKQQLFTPTTFSLVYATDFADRYEHQILPMLKAGFIVLCDRYIFTSFARDAVRGCDPLWLRELYGFAHLPEITFYLELPLHVALERAYQGRAQIGYIDAGMDLGLSQDVQESFRLLQGRLADQYLLLASEFAFHSIDATRPIHAQQSEIRRIVAEQIDLGAYSWTEAE